MCSHKIANGLQDSLIDIILGFGTCREPALGDLQRMVSAFDNVEFVFCFHFLSNALQQFQRTEPVTRSLHKQDWSGHCTEHLSSELGRIATAAKRIAKADDRSNSLLKGEMASDPRPKTLSDKNGRPAVYLPAVSECFAMSSDEPRKGIGTLFTFSHIGIVEKGYRTNSRQLVRPTLHPRMRGRSASSVSKEKEGSPHTSASYHK